VNTVSVGISESKRLLGKHRQRRKDNTLLDLTEVGLHGANLIHWRANVNSVTNLRVPSDALNCLTI
jgi:hypothetical protein